MARIGMITEAFEVFMKIPELGHYLTMAEMKDRAASDPIVLVSEREGELVGFKIGYAISETDFYSWLGGVIPDMRHLGVAQRMMELQEEIVVERGFTRITVKSMNRFRSMLHLLIKNGYNITHVENRGHPEQERVCFSKTLQSLTHL